MLGGPREAYLWKDFIVLVHFSWIYKLAFFPQTMAAYYEHFKANKRSLVKLPGRSPWAWSYQQNSQKIPQNFARKICQIFGVASWTKFLGFFFQGILIGAHFQKSKNLDQILRNFSENFVDRIKPRCEVFEFTVNWNSDQKYCKWIFIQIAISNKIYRLCNRSSFFPLLSNI